MKVPTITDEAINTVASRWKQTANKFGTEAELFAREQPAAAKAAKEMSGGNQASAYMIQLGMLLMVRWLEEMEAH